MFLGPDYSIAARTSSSDTVAKTRGGIVHRARGEEFAFVQQFTGDFLSRNGSSKDSARTTFKSALTFVTEFSCPHLERLIASQQSQVG